MAGTEKDLNSMVTALVPTLSRSLAEQFNVFRVMHHGTHEKQLSNVFAWLLRTDGTHGRGDAFQRTFVELVNRGLPPTAPLPSGGYRVLQEVDTSRHESRGEDIADIVLINDEASIVVENFEFSDGHGHDYEGYRAYGATGDRCSTVVLLCARRETHLQRDGWEEAVTITYAELLDALSNTIEADHDWQRSHPGPHFLVQQLVQHFSEGPRAVSRQDQIAFIKAMCETGESARYGYRPQAVAAEEFAELVGQHAKRQFEDGRGALAEIKHALRRYVDGTLIAQVQGAVRGDYEITGSARLQGEWEWCVQLTFSDSRSSIYLEFGPTVVVKNQRVPSPLPNPDYDKIFVTREAKVGDTIHLILQTTVGLEEVLEGIDSEDVRLRDAVLEAMAASTGEPGSR